MSHDKFSSIHSLPVVQQTPEELAYVQAARDSDWLAELCHYETYHPDHGQVAPYWKPMYLDFWLKCRALP